MKVARYFNNNDVRLDEIDQPEIGSGELLVRIRKSGICGSDVLEYYRLAKMERLGVDSLILGHEIAGDIVEIGEDVKKYHIGDKVFVSHHVPCFDCHYCNEGHHTACKLLHNTNFDPGGFAEYVRIPNINIKKKGVYILEDEISYEDGVFIEPLGCVCRAQRLANIHKGQSILILGSGVSGLLHLKLALTKGVEKIITTDISKFRMKKAKEFGAYATLDARKNIAQEVRKVNEGRNADIIIVCTGAVSAANQALECAGSGSTIVFFAVPPPGVDLEIPINTYWRNEVKIMTSYG
ncbi:MAG: alcohol dehydrogenase catalytic domain-containing protein, partial [Candidatus Lokiarchaeota archaeon]|nr:alcohol dehydrogenase catalytic domain-containing protein [Candidatus Lokiarchaeota archaeon]MBD3200521.1 alcohol dehydrogenase catalytic domain-containing protein [Candidatus Lokiarchaeota archaeon]